MKNETGEEMTSLRPFFLCALGVFFGSVLDATVKAIAADTPVLTLTAWRFLFGAVIVLGIYLARGGGMPTTAAIRFHTMRGAVYSITVLSFFSALAILPLAMATVIGFTAALMVAPVARLILKERMNRTAVLAALIGFAGVALNATGFGGMEIEPQARWLGYAFALVAAVTYAMTLVLIRLRAQTEDSVTIVMFSNVVAAVFTWIVLIGAALIMKDGPPIWPGAAGLPALGLLAVIGVSVWLLMTFAYSGAEAGRLAPFEYTALVWSALFGAFFFGEVPGLRLYAGAAIIIGACLLVAFETHFTARREARLPASDILE